jgi:hypothetical protein
MQIARVAVQHQLQLRRAGEMDPVDRFGKFLQLRLPGRQVGVAGHAEHFPVAELRRVADFAGQGDFCAGEVRLKMVE